MTNKGFVLGEHKGKVVQTNPKDLMNSSICLIGPSGCGKTGEAQNIMMECANAGYIGLAFDFRGTLSDDQILPTIKKDFDELKIEIDAYNNGILVDLLHLNDSDEESIRNVVELLASSTGMKLLQKAELRSAVKHMFEEGTYNSRGIEVLGEYLEEIGSNAALSARERLHEVTSNNFFRPGEFVLEQGKINIVRMNGYDLQTQIDLSEMLLHFIWRLAQRSYYKNNPIFIFVDEVHNMPSGENSIIAQILSEGRRFGVNLILATQMLQSGSTSLIQQRLSQCGLMLYFKPQSDKIDMIARLIEPTKKSDWKLTLASLRVGEFVACGSFLLGGKAFSRPLVVSARHEKSEVNDFNEKEVGVNGICE